VSSPLTKDRGFTLIEVLIASSIFSIVTLAAYSGFQIIASSKVRQEQAQAQLAELERGFLILSQDISQIVPRAINDELGGVRRPLEFSTYNGASLAFSRTGWVNPAPDILPPRSELQRVAYQADDGRLQRVSWYHLDRMVEGTENTRTLMRDVDALRWRFLDVAREWHDTWPPTTADPNAAFPMPVAIQVIIEHTALGDIDRLFVVAD